MRLHPLPMSALALLACATPVTPVTGGTVLAQQPGSDCVVGTAAYPTIQSAVDTAACTTIRVAAGTYYESVAIGRSLTIRGAGPERTVVDATGKDSSVFRINGPASRQVCDPPVVIVTLAGMTITGGTGPAAPSPQRNGGGIGASPGVKLTVENVVVTGNSAHMNGGGISVPNGRLTIVDSVITRNTAYANPQPNQPLTGGGGVRMAGCPAVLIVKNSVIRDNVSYRFGGGIYSYVPAPGVILGGISIPGPDGTMVIVGSDIMRNTAAEADGGGGIYQLRTDVTVLDSSVKHNYPDDVKQGSNP